MKKAMIFAAAAMVLIAGYATVGAAEERSLGPAGEKAVTEHGWGSRHYGRGRGHSWGGGGRYGPRHQDSGWQGRCGGYAGYSDGYACPGAYSCR